MKYLYLTFFILSIHGIDVNGQNTVGTITNGANSYNGYTLFSPNHSTETYLINNCGEIINQWTSSYKPGVALYLLDNGDLLRTGKIDNTAITFGGVGGKIELFDWDNNLIWEYTYSSTSFTQHHDIYPLPNGNILMLAVTVMTEEEAIQEGRDPSKLIEGKLFNERIIELQPIGSNQANIIWIWDIKDHLIQDFDASKSNFGVIANNPQLLNINYLGSEGSGEANWLHINSLQYNPLLDQIILSSRLMNEIYIIDHSTTTLQASQHSGGIYGKGGDFLYRWGNPEAYDHGNNVTKRLWGQHYPHWILDGLTDSGKILIFNNGFARGTNNDEFYSSIDIINPTQSSSGFYTYDEALGFGPSDPEWTYTKPIKEEFYSPILSNAQRLPNGNTLICEGFFGRFFEIDSSNKIVWEYTNPDTTSAGEQIIQTQGELPNALGAIFRAIKYSTDYSAFNGRDLTPSNPIELNSHLNESCSTLEIIKYFANEVKIYPNPVSASVTIESSDVIKQIELYNVVGKNMYINYNLNSLDLANFKSGIYFVHIYFNNKVIVKKIVKQ